MSKVAELYELPQGWQWSTIGEIAGYVSRGRAPKYVAQNGVPILNQKCIRWNGIEWQYAKLTDSSIAARLAGEQYLLAGDVLWNSTGTGTIGRAAVFRPRQEREKVLVDTHVTIVRPSIVDPELLQHWISSHAVQKQLDRMQTGSTNQVELSRSQVLSTPFPLPPKNEQTLIVAKLDELFSRIEKGEENLKRVQALVKRYRQAVLKAAVTGELTRDWREKNAGKGETGAELLQRILAARRAAWEKVELAKMKAKGRKPRDDGWKRKYEEPEPADVSDLPDLPLGWAWASLNQLSWSSSYGTSTKCSYEGEGPPVLRIPNVRSGGVVLDDLKYAIGKLAVAAHEYLAPGDLLVVRTNGSRALIGLGAVVDRTLQDPTYFASYLIRFRLNTVGALADWVNTFWQSDVIRRLVLKNAATSAGQYNISQTVMSAFPVALPPATELDEVLLRVQSMLTRVDAIERAVTDAAGTASALRQSTLRAAFSGELVAQDSGDVPATVLLERIAIERANGAAAEPRRGRPKKAMAGSSEEALS